MIISSCSQRPAKYLTRRKCSKTGILWNRKLVSLVVLSCLCNVNGDEGNLLPRSLRRLRANEPKCKDVYHNRLKDVTAAIFMCLVFLASNENLWRRSHTDLLLLFFWTPVLNSQGRKNVWDITKSWWPVGKIGLQWTIFRACTASKNIALEEESACRWRQKGRKCERRHASNPKPPLLLLL